MELRQLEYFQMVSRLGSFTKAAEKLHVAQPSVTNAIGKLEDELGIRLFDRNQKKVALTAEGRIFQRRVDKILREVAETLAEMHDLKNLGRGAIKAAVPPMIGAYLFPNIFISFKKAYPGLDLQVFEEGSLAARMMIEREELDLGIIILPEETAVFHTLPIVEEEIVLCLPPAHPLSGKQAVTFSELRHEPFILLKEDSCHRRFIIDRCRESGFAPRIVFSSNQIQTIKALVASGGGISFLMRMVAEDAKNITTVPLAPALKIRIGLAWKKDKYLSKAARAFIDFVAGRSISQS